MDVLAAIALGTEPYSHSSNSQQSRISRKAKIMLPEMWRQILCHAAYQVFIMLILMYFGVFMFFDETFNIILTPLRKSDLTATNRLVLNTICFHTFILMNLFNQIKKQTFEPADRVFGY